MTNQVSNTLAVENNTAYNDKTTMQSLNELLGLHLLESRIVFDADGHEVVFINDNFLGFITIYIDGERALRHWSLLSFIMSDSTVVHDKTEYRVVTVIKNWVTSAQKVTLIVDDAKAQTQIDPLYGAMKWSEILHASAVPFLLGLSLAVFL